MRYLLVFMLLLISACSNNPTKFILAPQAFAPQNQALSQTKFNLQLVDSRAMPYTLKVMNGNKSFQLKTSNDLLSHLKTTITQALTEQGAAINSSNDYQVKIQIAQLQALVQQNTLDHTVTNQVAFIINVQTAAGAFTKTYSGDGNYTGPFTMDVAAVERELRLLTEQVLSQLLQDSSWQHFLRS